jgi:indolepyruvate ferredoxin oxidoreductase beta subunit
VKQTTPKSHESYRRPFNLIIAGVGGQGILRAARLIAGAAHHSGFTVSVGETFGASRRGGTVLSHIRLLSLKDVPPTIKAPIPTGPLVPHHRVDVLMGLEPLETLRAGFFLQPQSYVLLNSRIQLPINLLTQQNAIPSFSSIESQLLKLCKKLWSINANDLALAAGEERTVNTVMVGVLAGLGITPVTNEAFQRALSTQFTDSEVYETNLKAYELGYKTGKDAY